MRAVTGEACDGQCVIEPRSLVELAKNIPKTARELCSEANDAFALR